MLCIRKYIAILIRREKSMDMDSKKREQIGKRIISALAKSDNKTQKNLSEHLHIPENTVSYWCNGKRTPNVMQIIEISEYLNVSTDYLLGLSEHKTVNKDKEAICQYIGCSETTLESLQTLYGRDGSNEELITIALNSPHQREHYPTVESVIDDYLLPESIQDIVQQNIKNIVFDTFLPVLFYEPSYIYTIVVSILSKCYKNYIKKMASDIESRMAKSLDNIELNRKLSALYGELEDINDSADLLEYKVTKNIVSAIDNTVSELMNSIRFSENGIVNNDGNLLLHNCCSHMWGKNTEFEADFFEIVWNEHKDGDIEYLKYFKSLVSKIKKEAGTKEAKEYYELLISEMYKEVEKERAKES